MLTSLLHIGSCAQLDHTVVYLDAVCLALQRSTGKPVVDRVSPGAFAASKPRVRHQSGQWPSEGIPNHQRASRHSLGLRWTPCRELAERPGERSRVLNAAHSACHADAASY